jgi:hypothetical protein
MGNTTKSCIFEISRIFLHCSLYDITKYFQKYNWKYHLSAVLLWAVINAQRALEVHGKHVFSTVIVAV